MSAQLHFPISICCALASALFAIAGFAAAPPDPFVPQYLPPRARAAYAAPETGAAPTVRKPSHPVSHHAEHKPPAHDPKATRILDIAGLGEVTVYAPRGEARGLALFASGDGGWELGVWDMAQQAASLGYWVAGFSTPALLKSLEHGTGACSDAASTLADLGARVRAALDITAQYRPILIGYSSGATVAYAALAQAGDERFSGAMTLGFCPDLIYHKPFCEDAGLTADKQHKPPFGYVFNTVPAVPAPWIVLQGDIDKVCNPPATRSFVEKVKNGKVVDLPHVGHGYGVPRNWMPQYIQGLIELRDGEIAAGARVASSNQ